MTNLTTYTFAVRAVNVIREGPSATKDATPASATPAAPGLSATAGDTQVKLEWADPNDSSIDKYQYSTDGGTGFIDIDADAIDYSVANTIGYTVTSLTNDTEYTFHIRAVDNQALQPYGDASDVTATPAGTLPDSPLNLEAEPGHEEVRLSWGDPNDASIDKYHYSIYSIDGITNSTNISADATTYTITGLTNGTTYTFQIWAENATGVGPASAIDAKPLPPQLVRPTLEPPEEGNGEVKLKWAYTHVETKETILRYEVLHLLKTSKLDGVGGDKFGYAVAVDGDTAVIGAYQDNGNGADSGAAYVFTRNDGVWDDGVKLTASGGAAYDNFGISVAVDGDTVVVGAPGNDGAGADSGIPFGLVNPSIGHVRFDFTSEEGVHILCQRHTFSIPQFRVRLRVAVLVRASGCSFVALSKRIEDRLADGGRQLDPGMLRRVIKNVFKSMTILYHCLRQTIQHLRERLLQPASLLFFLGRHVASLP